MNCTHRKSLGSDRTRGGERGVEQAGKQNRATYPGQNVSVSKNLQVQKCFRDDSIVVSADTRRGISKIYFLGRTAGVSFRSALGPTQPRIKSTVKDVCQWTQRPKHETSHSLPSSAEDKNGESACPLPRLISLPGA
jgi:hypothetical protein